MITVKELRERDYGSYTGRRVDKVDWDKVPEDAETSGDVQERMRMFLEKVYAEHPDDTIVFVSHGRASLALVNEIMHNPAKMIDSLDKLRNTSVSIFEIKEDKQHTIVLLNCTKHLENLPTRKQCMDFYRELDTPNNIIKH